MNWQLTRGEKIFQTVNALVLGLIAVSMIYPFIYIISISLSTPAEASRGGLHLFPGKSRWPRTSSFFQTRQSSWAWETRRCAWCWAPC